VRRSIMSMPPVAASPIVGLVRAFLGVCDVGFGGVVKLRECLATPTKYEEYSREVFPTRLKRRVEAFPPDHVPSAKKGLDSKTKRSLTTAEDPRWIFQVVGSAREIRRGPMAGIRRTGRPTADFAISTFWSGLRLRCAEDGGRGGRFS